VSYFKILLATFLLIPASYGSVAETTLLAKILGQSVAQLKELHEIWNIQNSTLAEVEKANRVVQQTRYQVLRAKFIVDSAKTLSESNITTPQDALNVMRTAKNLGRSGSNWMNEIHELTPAEKKELVKQLEEFDVQAQTIEEQILERKLSLSNTKMNEVRLEKHSKETAKYSTLVDVNESRASGAIDPQTATIETAKNTAITNQLLLQSSQIQGEHLKETYRMNSLLETEQLRKLQEEESSKQLWGIKR
jgi:hypothetical protein